jgi:DNA-binding transcriptional ArsR family regulator
MTALRFGETDALRCRFAISPLFETLAGVRLIARHHRRSVYDPWLEAKAAAVAALDLDPLHVVQPHIGHTPDFLAPPPRERTNSFEAELPRVRATARTRIVTELKRSRDEPVNPRAEQINRMLTDPLAARDQLADTIAQAWTTLIEPDWPAIHRVLEDDIAYRSTQLTSGGLAALFDDLHPNLVWHDNQLIAARYDDQDRDLAGAGLLLMPSAFTWPHLLLIVDRPYQPTIVYPARGIARLWTDTPPPPDRLARLLGRTRATLLTALDPAATTSELALQYGLALATVGEHLTVLDSAGLASRRRAGHKVHYRRTELGQALIDASVD